VPSNEWIQFLQTTSLKNLVIVQINYLEITHLNLDNCLLLYSKIINEILINFGIISEIHILFFFFFFH